MNVDAASPLLWRWTTLLLLAAVPVWVASSGFVWWVLGVRLNAADNRRAEPAWVTQWDGPALVLAVCAFLTFCTCLVVTVRAIHRG